MSEILVSMSYNESDGEAHALAFQSRNPALLSNSQHGMVLKKDVTETQSSDES